MSRIYPWLQPTWDKYSHARSRNHLPHALLISGESGIGKHHLAKTMVKSLLCLSSQDKENYFSCNNCQGCKTYESGANPDYLNIELLDGKQQIAVDQIRGLSNFLNYTSSLNGTRVMLINPIERMNKNAANSLLKSLEEPSNNAMLILVSSNLSQILPTIKSRCQLLTAEVPTHRQAMDWLHTEAPSHLNIEKSLDLANGKPLHAVDIKEDLIKSREELYIDIFELIQQKKSITEIAKKWEKFDLTKLLNWQIRTVQDFIKNKNSITQVQRNIKEKLELDHQWTLYDSLVNQKQLVHTSVNPLMFIENMLISWIDDKQ